MAADDFNRAAARSAFGRALRGSQAFSSCANSRGMILASPSSARGEPGLPTCAVFLPMWVDTVMKLDLWV
jgi:hypothetical protein